MEVQCEDVDCFVLSSLPALGWFSGLYYNYSLLTFKLIYCLQYNCTCESLPHTHAILAVTPLFSHLSLLPTYIVTKHGLQILSSG
jgi:hypothetical protein